MRGPITEAMLERGAREGVGTWWNAEGQYWEIDVRPAMDMSQADRFKSALFRVAHGGFHASFMLLGGPSYFTLAVGSAQDLNIILHALTTLMPAGEANWMINHIIWWVSEAQQGGRAGGTLGAIGPGWKRAAVVYDEVLYAAQVAPGPDPTQAELDAAEEEFERANAEEAAWGATEDADYDDY